MTIPEFGLLIATLAVPLSLGVPVLAGCTWHGLDATWLLTLVGALTLLCIVAQFLSRACFYGTFPGPVNVLLRDVVVCGRLLLLIVFVTVVFPGARARGREGWLAVAVALTLGVGLFAQELSTMGIRGIWFPFGVGVSRTEYPDGLFDLMLFALLVRRLGSVRAAPSMRGLAGDRGSIL